MKIFNTSAAIILIAISLMLSACTGTTMNKLQGKWVVVNIYDPNSPDVEEWEFTNDGQIHVTNTNPTYGNHSGKYKVEAGFLETRLYVSDFPNQYNFYNADWWIVELKNKKLYIVHDKDGGLYNKEFERER